MPSNPPQVSDRNNVIECGATPDLSLPSDAAFAAAIDLATKLGGGEVVVPPGRYLLTKTIEIVGLNAVSLRGLGRPELLFRRKGEAPGPAIRVENSHALSIERLNLNCEDNTTCGVEATSSHFMRLEGLLIQGTGLGSPGAHALRLNDCYNGAVTRCVFDPPHGAQAAVFHGPHCNQWMYQACKIVHRGGVGLDLHGGFSVQIHACDISGSGIGAKIGQARSVGFHGVHAEGCRVGIMTGKHGEVVVRECYFNLQRSFAETRFVRRRIGVLVRGGMATVENSFFLGSHDPDLGEVVSTAVVIRDVAHEATRQIHVSPSNTYQAVYPVVELMDTVGHGVSRRVHVGTRWAAKAIGDWPPEIKVPGGGVAADGTRLMLARYTGGPTLAELIQTWLMITRQSDVPPELQQDVAFPDDIPANDGWLEPLDLT